MAPPRLPSSPLLRPDQDDTDKIIGPEDSTPNRLCRLIRRLAEAEEEQLHGAIIARSASLRKYVLSFQTRAKALQETRIRDRNSTGQHSGSGYVPLRSSCGIESGSGSTARRSPVRPDRRDDSQEGASTSSVAYRQSQNEEEGPVTALPDSKRTRSRERGSRCERSVFPRHCSYFRPQGTLCTPTSVFLDVREKAQDVSSIDPASTIDFAPAYYFCRNSAPTLAYGPPSKPLSLSLPNISDALHSVPHGAASERRASAESQRMVRDRHTKEHATSRHSDRWIKTSAAGTLLPSGIRGPPMRSWLAVHGFSGNHTSSHRDNPVQAFSLPRVEPNDRLSRLSSSVLASRRSSLSRGKAWGGAVYDPVNSSRVCSPPSRSLLPSGERVLEKFSASPGAPSSAWGLRWQSTNCASHIDSGRSLQLSGMPWSFPARPSPSESVDRAPSSVAPHARDSAAGNASLHDAAYGVDLPTSVSPLVTSYTQKGQVLRRSRKSAGDSYIVEEKVEAASSDRIIGTQHPSLLFGTPSVISLNNFLMPPPPACTTYPTRGRSLSASPSSFLWPFRLSSLPRTERRHFALRQTPTGPTELFSFRTLEQALSGFDDSPPAGRTSSVLDTLDCWEPQYRRSQRLLSEVSRVQRQSQATSSVPFTRATPRAPPLVRSAVLSTPLSIKEARSSGRTAVCGTGNCVVAGLDSLTLKATTRSLPLLPSPRNRSHGNAALQKEISRVSAVPIPPSPRSALRNRSLVNILARPANETENGIVQSAANLPLNAYPAHVSTPLPPPGMIRKPSMSAVAHAYSELPTFSIDGKITTSQKEKRGKERFALTGATSLETAEAVLPLRSKVSISNLTCGGSRAGCNASSGPYVEIQRGRTKRQTCRSREVVEGSGSRRWAGTGERRRSRASRRDLAKHLFDLDRLFLSRSLPVSEKTESSTLTRTSVRTNEVRVPSSTILKSISSNLASGELGQRGTSIHTPSASVGSVRNRAYPTRVAKANITPPRIEDTVHVHSIVEVRETVCRAEELSAHGGLCFSRLRSRTSRRSRSLAWLAQDRLPSIPGRGSLSSTTFDGRPAGERNYSSSSWLPRNNSMNGNSGHRQFGSGTGSSQHEETQEAALSSSTSQAVGGEVSRGASTLSPSSPLTLSLLLDEAASAADVEDDVVFQMWLDQEAVLERALPLHDILAREEAVERALVASMAAMGRTDLDSFLAMIQQPLLLLHQSSYWRGAGIAQGSQGSRGWARLWGFDAAVRVAGGTGGAGAGERSRPLSEAEISRNTRRWTFRNRGTKATKQKDSAVAKCAKGACSCGQEEGAPPARRASVGYSGSNLPRSSTCSTLCKEAKKRSTYQSSIVAQPPLPPGAAGVREQFSGGCGSTSMRHITAGSSALSAGGGRRAGEGSCVNSTGNGADRGKDEEQTDSEDSSRCCSICLAEYQTGDDMMTLRCMHMFHHHCVHDWLTHSGRRVCPLCLVTIIESEGKGEEEFKIREPSAGDIAERGAARAACGDTTENGGTGEEYREEQAEVG